MRDNKGTYYITCSCYW